MKIRSVRKMGRRNRIAAIFFALLLFATPTLSQSDEDSAGHEEIDLSMWVKDRSKWGNTAFRSNQFYMRAKSADKYFYVLIAPDDYTSARQNTRVTLRNVRGLRTKLGYGLVFHSTPEPLVRDYAFLIDSITRRYRVVRHAKGKERVVIKWKSSAAIRPGKRRNILEVRDKGDSVALYINQRFIRNLKTRYATPNGQPGLYTDATPIAFREFILIDQRISVPKPKPRRLDLEIGLSARTIEK